MTTPLRIRRHFVQTVSLLSDPDAQLRYERDLPLTPAHVELVESFYDLYFPEDELFAAAFSADETRHLAELEAELAAATRNIAIARIQSVAELHAFPAWDVVVHAARAAHALFLRNELQAPALADG